MVRDRVRDPCVGVLSVPRREDLEYKARSLLCMFIHSFTYAIRSQQFSRQLLCLTWYIVTPTPLR